MVAYEGFVQYEPNPPAVRQIAQDWITGEGAPLMKCTGDGLLYLADYGADVVVINLNGDGISVNATNLLAFDAHLHVGRRAGQGPGEVRRAGPVEHQDLRAGLGRADLARHADRRRLRRRRGRDVRRPRRARRLVPEPQGEGQAQLQGAVADRPGQRRGLPDGLLRPGHRRRPAQRGQHRPPPDPGLRGSQNTMQSPLFALQRPADPGALEPAEHADAPRHPGGPRRRARPQGHHGRLPGPGRVRRRVPEQRPAHARVRTPARAWT